MATPRRVFISYRRDDTAPYAGRVYDWMHFRLRDEVEVFMDVDNIPPGADFVEVIEEAVGNCDVFLALIGPEWVNARNASGVRRLDDPGDFVRLEIAAALERGIKVVPLLLRGAEMPAARDLPPEIARLARREALELSDKRWQQDVGRLERAITGPLAAPKARTDVKASPAPPVTEPVPTPPEPSSKTLTPKPPPTAAPIPAPPPKTRAPKRERAPKPAREPKPDRARKPEALKPRSPVEPGPPSTTSRTLRDRWPIIAGAGALVAVLIVALAFAGGGGGGDDDDDPKALAVSTEPTNVTCPRTPTPRADSGVELDWTKPSSDPLQGSVVANPAQSWAKYVIATDRGEIAAFEPTGTMFFRDRLDGGVIGDPGQLVNPLYFGTTGGGLYRVDLSATGAERLERLVRADRPLGGVAIEEGRAYVGRLSKDGGLLVVEAETGTVERVVKTDGAVFGKPWIDEATKSVYFASTGGSVYRMRLPSANDTTVQRFRVAGPVEAPVRLRPGQLVIATTNGVIEALNPTTGEQLWGWKIPQGESDPVGVFHAPAIAAGATLVATSDCRVIALALDGKPQGEVRLGAPISVGPLVLAGGVFIADDDGCVSLLRVGPAAAPQIARSTNPCETGIKARSLNGNGKAGQIRVGTSGGQLAVFTYDPITAPSG